MLTASNASTSAAGDVTGFTFMCTRVPDETALVKPGLEESFEFEFGG